MSIVKKKRNSDPEDTVTQPLARLNSRIAGWYKMRWSRVAKQGHETKVHVLLDMAVK